MKTKHIAKMGYSFYTKVFKSVKTGQYSFKIALTLLFNDIDRINPLALLLSCYITTLRYCKI